MKKILLIIGILLLVTKAYADVRAYRLGSVAQDSLTGVEVLASAPDGGHYMTFETPVGTDYVVPASTTFYITKMDLKARTIAEGVSVEIGYGDDGVASGAAAPTNYVAMTGSYTTKDADSTLQFNILVPIPTGKYPCARSTAGASNDAEVTVYGIEVAD